MLHGMTYAIATSWLPLPTRIGPTFFIRNIQVSWHISSLVSRIRWIISDNQSNFMCNGSLSTMTDHSRKSALEHHNFYRFVLEVIFCVWTLAVKCDQSHLWSDLEAFSSSSSILIEGPAWRRGSSSMGKSMLLKWELQPCWKWFVTANRTKFCVSLEKRVHLVPRSQLHSSKSGLRCFIHIQCLFVRAQ